MILRTALFGDDCSSVGTHKTCDIRTHDLSAGFFFKGTKNRFVVEGTALGQNLFTVFFGAADLDDFVKSVFYDRVRKTCRDIFDACPFLLGLLYFGIHKYRTAVAKVHRFF